MPRWWSHFRRFVESHVIKLCEWFTQGANRKITCFKMPNLNPESRSFHKKELKIEEKLGSCSMCATVKSRYIGDGHPTFTRNPYNGYINPYYWVDDHPLLYGNNGSLDPGTCNTSLMNAAMPFKQLERSRGQGALPFNKPPTANCHTD